jgi:hypothetical protein
LRAFNDGIIEWQLSAPATDERNDDESAPAEDVAAIDALDPPPATVDDARERLHWRKHRAANAMRARRESGARRARSPCSMPSARSPRCRAPAAAAAMVSGPLGLSNSGR